MYEMSAINPYSLNFGQNGGGAMGFNGGTGMVPPLSQWGSNAPGGAGGQGATQGFELGFNAPTLQMGMQGAGMLANIWGGFQANKLAREQLDFTKSVTNTNLNNSIKSYNTQLEDRARSRGYTEGQSAGQTQDYVTANRLSR